MGKIEDLDERYKTLSHRRDTLQKNKNRIEAELEARKRNLKAQMEEAKKAGFNPDNLQEDIRRSEEVLLIKLDNFEAELEEAERAMTPMLEEIKG
jgi:chaperonin cofactor prefoldin